VEQDGKEMIWDIWDIAILEWFWIFLVWSFGFENFENQSSNPKNLKGSLTSFISFLICRNAVNSSQSMVIVFLVTIKFVFYQIQIHSSSLQVSYLKVT
jgi:multisubunit Na+/H+ antiporter MnhE subunit